MHAYRLFQGSAEHGAQRFVNLCYVQLLSDDDCGEQEDIPESQLPGLPFTQQQKPAPFHGSGLQAKPASTLMRA
jgi:hypothetical protein